MALNNAKIQYQPALQVHMTLYAIIKCVTSCTMVKPKP